MFDTQVILTVACVRANVMIRYVFEAEGPAQLVGSEFVEQADT